MPSPPLKLLLSAFARHTWGDRILQAVPSGEVTLVTAEEALAAAQCDADIAFMTREVTGKSSKDNPTPELAGFDAVVRKASKLKWLQIHPAGAERPGEAPPVPRGGPDGRGGPGRGDPARVRAEPRHGETLDPRLVGVRQVVVVVRRPPRGSVLPARLSDA